MNWEFRKHICSLWLGWGHIVCEDKRWFLKREKQKVYIHWQLNPREGKRKNGIHTICRRVQYIDKEVETELVPCDYYLSSLQGLLWFLQVRPSQACTHSLAWCWTVSSLIFSPSADSDHRNGPNSLVLHASSLQGTIVQCEIRNRDTVNRSLSSPMLGKPHLSTKTTNHP